MKKKLVIFGAGDIGQLAHYYFTTDSQFEVVAFAIDKEFIKSDVFCGLPVIALDDLQGKYSSDDYFVFVALSYSKLNLLRKEKYLLCKSLGYRFASYISSKATVLNNLSIGENCFILEDNTIQPFVTIGNNVTLWSGNHIGHHSSIADHCFISSHVVVSGGVTIEESCFLGVNSTLRDHITIGKQTIVGAGALILESTVSESLYVGLATQKRDWPSTSVKKI